MRVEREVSKTQDQFSGQLTAHQQAMLSRLLLLLERALIQRGCDDVMADSLQSV
jgi:nitrate/nitrite-specific signal transduction histidine kinase